MCPVQRMYQTAPVLQEVPTVVQKVPTQYSGSANRKYHLSSAESKYPVQQDVKTPDLQCVSSPSNNKYHPSLIESSSKVLKEVQTQLYRKYQPSPRGSTNSA